MRKKIGIKVRVDVHHCSGFLGLNHKNELPSRMNEIYKWAERFADKISNGYL